ncbi:MAG TPA: MFS transporter, partial [Leptospiraceae bacterium]|nr:MFS transporter [Leptospiraceae bacterium]
MQDKHHRALPILFFTEMWERFSYYGMRGLLIFYLTKHLLMSDAAAGKIYGAYTALVYLAPLLGGYAADNILGRIKSVYIGGILMMIGHFSLALEGIFFFYAGLAFLIFGNGFFKPNMSSLLGELYTEKQTLRES